MLPINELLQEGRYQITRQIGQNDIGSIYEGIDNIFEKKIIINQCAYSGRKNLSDEEKILKGIKHETFLHVTDYFAEPNSWFVIMEAEDGEFLSEVLENEKSVFQILDVINWTDQLLDGFSYLHLNLPPVIYGDLRAQNIFLTSDGKIKLLTSAILKNRISIPNFGKSSSAALNYAPLEQIWNSLDSASQKVIADKYDETAEKILREPADARSDIFSLGVLIYRLLSGEFPKNALERSIEILEGNPDPLVSPSEINTEIAPEISEIIMKTLEIRREDRLDSAVIMRQILRTAFVRIKEREAASAEQKEPTEILVLEESFGLSDIAAPAEIKTAEPIQISESEEMPEEPSLEIEAGNIIETVSAGFLNFDEDDEKLLGIENSAEVIKELKPSPEIIEEKAEIIDVQTSEKIVPEVVKTDFAKDYSPDEFSILFDNTEEKNRSKWTIPVVVIILVLAGSGVLGAWVFISRSDSNAATQTVQTVASQPEIKPSVNSASEPPAENLTLSNSESQTSSNTENIIPTPGTDIEANPVLTQQTAPPVKKQTVVKTKPNASKPQTASAKIPEKEKKKVTADDLISDY